MKLYVNILMLCSSFTVFSAAAGRPATPPLQTYASLQNAPAGVLRRAATASERQLLENRKKEKKPRPMASSPSGVVRTLIF